MAELAEQGKVIVIQNLTIQVASGGGATNVNGTQNHIPNQRF